MEANRTRKDFIVNSIIEKLKITSINSNKIVGIYRLIIKRGSDNFYIRGIIKRIKAKAIYVVIYEPNLK